MLDIRFAKEDVRAVLASKIQAEMNSNLARESDRHAPKVPAGKKGAAILPQSLPESLPKSTSEPLPKSLNESLPQLLPPQLVKNLFRFFSAQNPRQLSAADNDSVPSKQSVIKAAEGLALVLATKVNSDAQVRPKPVSESEPVSKPEPASESKPVSKPEPASKPETTNQLEPASKPEPASKSENTASRIDRPVSSNIATTQTASEKKPVDQPVLGDNLSLEGANNPQAFTLLLLKERMADIEEELGKNMDGSVVDTVGANQLAQLLEQERVIDAAVVEALKDSERAEEAIRRASKA